MSDTPPAVEATFKLLLIGDSGTGKSSILLRFTDDSWLQPDEVSATIGKRARDPRPPSRMHPSIRFSPLVFPLCFLMNFLILCFIEFPMLLSFFLIDIQFALVRR